MGNDGRSLVRAAEITQLPEFPPYIVEGGFDAAVREPRHVTRRDEPSIRPFLDRDEAAVVALWRTVFPDDPPWNDLAAVIRRKCTVQRELFLVAEARGEVVGTVLAGFDGVRGWIHHLAVHPSARRSGVAKRLMQAAEEGLAGIGCPKVNLQVRATNPAVIGFYRKLGYIVEERVSLGKRLADVG